MISWFKIINLYGFRGFKSLVKLKLGLISYLRFIKDNFIIIYLPKCYQPIYLRPKTSDFATFRQIFLDKEYNIDLGYNPKVIIDAGANVGLAAIYFKNAYPDAQIYSIEPELSNFKMLNKNVEDYENIEVLQFALHHTSGNSLTIYDEGIGKWGFITKSPSNSEVNNAIAEIDTISISTIMTKYGLNTIDVLKVDIEGAERALFEKNYEDWLPNTKCVIIELHDRWYPGCKDFVFAAMNKYDFSHFKKGENFVFINPKYN